MNATVSAFRASAGGYVGEGHVHPALLEAAREAVAEARQAALVRDAYVARCGDDIALVLLHDGGTSSRGVHELVGDVFSRAVEVGRRLRQHGLEGREPDIDGAEVDFTVRSSEPVLCFFADKAEGGSWNVHLYRMFADPFNTPNLVRHPLLAQGFRFHVSGPRGRNGASSTFDLPCDLHRLLAAAGGGGCIREVRSRATGEVAAAASGGRDPVLVVRCGVPFPSVEEVLEAFAVPYALSITSGGAGPLVPVSANGDASTRSLGRAVGLGFQVTPDRLVGPRDLLGDAAFDEARRQAVAAADYLRRHGPFVPAR